MTRARLLSAIAVLAVSSTLFSCRKWKLERNNPYDEKSDIYAGDSLFGDNQNTFPFKVDLMKMVYDINPITDSRGMKCQVERGEDVYVLVLFENISTDTLYEVKTSFELLNQYSSSISPDTAYTYYGTLCTECPDDFDDYVAPGETAVCVQEFGFPYYPEPCYAHDFHTSLYWPLALYSFKLSLDSTMALKNHYMILARFQDGYGRSFEDTLHVDSLFSGGF